MIFPSLWPLKRSNRSRWLGLIACGSVYDLYLFFVNHPVCDIDEGWYGLVLFSSVTMWSNWLGWDSFAGVFESIT